MPKRDHTAALLIVLVLLLFASAAVLTRFPESLPVRAAEEWPLVGPLATAFRDHFAPAPARRTDTETTSRSSAAQSDRRATETVADGAEDARFEIDLEALEAHPYVWVPSGAVVRSEPRPTAPALREMEAMTNLSMLERRGDWFRVLVRRERGWVYLDGYEETSGEPPLGRAVEPPGPLPGRAPRAELLTAARQRFSSAPREIRFGAYRVLTDVEDEELLALCDRLAGEVEEIYRRRYGLELEAGPEAMVVLYRRQTDYQTLQSQTRRISRLPASGHVGNGLVAVYQGDRARPAVAGTLVHEMTHLLNRRSLGPALPPWLDEGIADDLGESGIDVTGTLRPGHLGGMTVRSGDRIEFSGAVASVILLRQGLETGRALPLPELIGLDWEGFVVGEGRPLHYAQSSFFVRFLLDDGDPELSADFRAFLRDVAAGGAVDAAALQQRLRAGWPELEARFTAWVAQIAGAVEDAGGS